jgi:hypothetical protein
MAKVPKDRLALRVLSDVLSLDVADKQPVAMGVPEGEENILTRENQSIRNSCIFKPVGCDARKCILKSALNVLEDRKQDYMT